MLYGCSKVVRGECSIEDIQVAVPKKAKQILRKIVRPAARQGMRICDYGDDIELKMPAGTLHVAMAQPRVAHHAKLLKIHTEEAEKMPGVYKVITAKDVHAIGGTNRLAWYTFLPRTLATEATHFLLCEDKIINYGNVVALVAADTKENARAAAAKITVDIEPLPEYLNYLMRPCRMPCVFTTTIPTSGPCSPLSRAKTRENSLKKLHM